MDYEGFIGRYLIAAFAIDTVKVRADTDSMCLAKEQSVILIEIASESEVMNNTGSLAGVMLTGTGFDASFWTVTSPEMPNGGDSADAPLAPISAPIANKAAKVVTR